jgi:hypothetical protein
MFVDCIKMPNNENTGKMGGAFPKSQIAMESCCNFATFYILLGILHR